MFISWNMLSRPKDQIQKMEKESLGTPYKNE